MVRTRLIATLLGLCFSLAACPSSTPPTMDHSLAANAQKISHDEDLAAILATEDCLPVAKLVDHLESLEQGESVIYLSSAGLVKTNAAKDVQPDPKVNSCYYFPEKVDKDPVNLSPLVEWLSNPSLSESKLIGKYLSLEQSGCDSFAIGGQTFTLVSNASASPKIANGKIVRNRTGLARLELLGEDGVHVVYRDNGRQLTITTRTPVTVAGNSWFDQREYVLDHDQSNGTFRLKVGFGQMLQNTLKVVPKGLDSLVSQNLKLNTPTPVGKKTAQTVDSVSVDLGSMMSMVEKINKRQFKDNRCK